nr:sulfotransferase domain-containing protein [Methylomarinum sp. Ch1-1]MDP4520285.1 sulfotransferase domain-containing protein [Methylomarinum sp. Ch1-1]
MMAMLERVLGVRANQQITLSHLRDIEVDWPKPNNHGAVVLVRDMRDVVVSWFHHLSRVDLQNGFSSPRYPNVEDFYFEHFIAQLFGSSRYYFGELEKWLDFVGANSFPVIKYEDLVSDTSASLRKVMNFWKISVPDQALFDIAQEHSFGNMQKNFFDQEGFVADMLKTGHLRSGRVGAWEEEMPTRVAEDINRRFFGYQRRLQYL